MIVKGLMLVSRSGRGGSGEKAGVEDGGASLFGALADKFTAFRGCLSLPVCV